jgi:hypothetical protein
MTIVSCPLYFFYPFVFWVLGGWTCGALLRVFVLPSNEASVFCIMCTCTWLIVPSRLFYTSGSQQFASVRSLFRREIPGVLLRSLMIGWELRS